MREKGEGRESYTLFFAASESPAAKNKIPPWRYGAEREGSESYSIFFAASESPAAKNKIPPWREKGEKR